MQSDDRTDRSASLSRRAVRFAIQRSGGQRPLPYLSRGLRRSCPYPVSFTHEQSSKCCLTASSSGRARSFSWARAVSSDCCASSPDRSSLVVDTASSVSFLHVAGCTCRGKGAGRLLTGAVAWSTLKRGEYMQATVSVEEAASNFAELLARVTAGEEVVIASEGKPVARVAPVE